MVRRFVAMFSTAHDKGLCFWWTLSISMMLPDWHGYAMNNERKKRTSCWVQRSEVENRKYQWGDSIVVLKLHEFQNYSSALFRAFIHRRNYSKMCTQNRDALPSIKKPPMLELAQTVSYFRGSNNNATISSKPLLCRLYNYCAVSTTIYRCL